MTCGENDEVEAIGDWALPNRNGWELIRLPAVVDDAAVVDGVN